LLGGGLVLGGECGIDGAERLGNPTPDPFRGPFDVVQRRLPPRGSSRIWALARNGYPSPGSVA
jgi:hypothetical protein